MTELKTAQPTWHLVQCYFAQHSFGRVLLHLVCAWRDHKYGWHWLGIRRELSLMAP